MELEPPVGRIVDQPADNLFRSLDPTLHPLDRLPGFHIIRRQPSRQQL